MTDTLSAKQHFPGWIFSLYFAEGVPAAIICEVAVVLFAALNYPPEKIAHAVSILGMPWVFKPIWSSLVDCTATKKKWIVAMQFLLCGVFGVAAFTLHTWHGILFYFLLAGAFFSATHDIAADGFYLVALDDHRQAVYSGWRSVCYRAAMIVANGGLLLFVAHTKPFAGLTSWQQALGLSAILFFALALWHIFTLPKERQLETRDAQSWLDAVKTLGKLPHLGAFLLFLLFYRFAEAQLTIIGKLFLLDPAGGAMELARYSLFNGVYAVAAMLAGGVIGGWAAAHWGLKKTLFPMALLLNVPDLLYLIWAFFPVHDPVLQATIISVEQFGYGFGFTGYMLLMLFLAGKCGKFKTTIFAYLTCLMILGLRLPGLFSGDILQKLPQYLPALGKYQLFYLWVTLATLVSFAVTLFAVRNLPADFGKKNAPSTQE
ncbi:MAG: hypothetical protein MJ033_00295 [Victivallaceae bacterium]|nr:hypothetical protein [Victivallaceae bacterium]